VLAVRPRRAGAHLVSLLAAVVTVTGAVVVVPAATPAQAAQPTPGHTSLVPELPRKNTPRIADGEIWDIEVVGDRVFIAGSFTSLANTSGNTASVNQRYLAAYNVVTGQIDTSFRPTFNGAVNTVEASPDGTKLFVGGSFRRVNGVVSNKVASLDLATGAPLASFRPRSTSDGPVTALEATNAVLYVGGRFTTLNGAARVGLAAMNAATGAVDLSFDNQISGGIGVNGALSVVQLRLTPDEQKLLVVHSGRKIAGQDRLGMGIIDTGSKQLLPWRSRLWDENLAIVGGVQRLAAADISPDGSYFVVGSGSGGDRPPISDTAVAFPIDGGDFTEPLWISRAFDSIYSIAITEKAVYLGGHFNWLESPTARQPWPGLDNVGYGWGQGLSGYGLGDEVVRREHIGAVDPATGTALEWNPESSSFEGNKAMKATSGGLFVGGDGKWQGGVNTGRVAYYDLASLPAPSTTDTTIDSPIEGLVMPAAAPFTIAGTASSSAAISRVQVEVQDRDTKQYLQDDLATWGPINSINATLGEATAGKQPWSLTLSLEGNRRLQLKAQAFATNGSRDPSKALKKIETFGTTDQTPSTGINGPTGIQSSTTFTVTGTAADDKGVTAIKLWFRDENQNYLQPDGSVAPIYSTVRIQPDVVGATAATWSYQVTLPSEGLWKAGAIAVDSAGQDDLRSNTREWIVDSTAIAPTVTVTQPATMTPPFAAPTVTVAPGGSLTFAGSAYDDDRLKNVEISLRNTSTRENLGADGTWGVAVASGWHRISPQVIDTGSYNWTYTTPFTLSPGTYTFAVRATDTEDLTTASANQGKLTINAQVPGDTPPDGLLTGGGTVSVTDPVLNLTGTATDDKGVAKVQLVVFDNDTGRYLQPAGTMTSDYTRLEATLAAPNATSTGWSRTITLPTGGDYSVTAVAVDTAGQVDGNTTGATGRYRYYPGDNPPVFEEALGQPVDGTTFTQGKIVVTGRAVDDISIARVEVAVVNAAGQYMSSSGTFTSTTPSWRTAFLNSPGSPGSNFSYTTPTLPAGVYQVLVRPMDHHDQYGLTRTASNVTVALPPNNPPVAAATVTCQENVCTFDGRGSTDENPTALVYSWTFGPNQGTATGPVPTKRFTAPGSFPVTLTVRDEWNATATTTVTVTITEPAGNQAPVPVLLTSCIALACSVSSTGSTDPNTGDVITYSWSFGDGSAPVAGPTATRTYATPGTYTVSLIATDAWGKATTVAKALVLVEPVDNDPPSPVITTTCSGRTCQVSSAGSTDPEGDQIRYSWDFGDGSAAATGATATRTYATSGTYTITLTATDGWNRSATTSQQVTVGP